MLFSFTHNLHCISCRFSPPKTSFFHNTSKFKKKKRKQKFQKNIDNKKKVVIVMEENKDYRDVIGNFGCAPYQVASRGALQQLFWSDSSFATKLSCSLLDPHKQSQMTMAHTFAVFYNCLFVDRVSHFLLKKYYTFIF